MVFCNIPYHLTSQLGGKAVISRAGGPITGGHFVTRVAMSYGLLKPRLTRTLTCNAGDNLSLGYLDSMYVIANMGSHWSILAYNDGEQFGQPKQQPRQRGRRNVRG